MQNVTRFIARGTSCLSIKRPQSGKEGIAAFGKFLSPAGNRTRDPRIFGAARWPLHQRDEDRRRSLLYKNNAFDTHYHYPSTFKNTTTPLHIYITNLPTKPTYSKHKYVWELNWTLWNSRPVPKIWEPKCSRNLNGPRVSAWPYRK